MTLCLQVDVQSTEPHQLWPDFSILAVLTRAKRVSKGGLDLRSPSD